MFLVLYCTLHKHKPLAVGAMLVACIVDPAARQQYVVYS
jgi:hypothetical protein